MDVIMDVKRHAYGDLLVLEDIRLHLHSGEIVSVIGPSGCGKSTLLSIMGGILKATEGSVWMDGETLRYELKMGMEGAPLAPHLTASFRRAER